MQFYIDALADAINLSDPIGSTSGVRMMRYVSFMVFGLTLLCLSTYDSRGQIPRMPTVRPSATPKPTPSIEQGDFPKHFFFTTAAKATGTTLRARDLVACISGDNASPSNARAFKRVVPTVGGQKGRVIDAGTCDVVVLVIKDADGEKNLERDNAGFAVYRIVGDDLELLFKPMSGDLVAVGKMDLASSQELNKLDIRACGHPELRNSYRPNPNTWKTWSNEYADGERISRMTVDNYPLKYSCDVWIMSKPIYESFVKRFGNKHPVFDINTTDPVLRRRK